VGRARPTSAWKPRSSRRQHWLTLPEGLATPGSELWDPVRPLYETGEYAEAAARGRELLGTHPDLGLLFYNTACCESLAREVEGAVSHLLGRVRGPRAGDSDFDPIRDDAAFVALLDSAEPLSRLTCRGPAGCSVHQLRRRDRAAAVAAGDGGRGAVHAVGRDAKARDRRGRVRD